MPKKKRKNSSDPEGVFTRGGIKHIFYQIAPGVQFKESTHQGEAREATRLRNQRMEEVRLGTWARPQHRVDRRTTVRRWVLDTWLPQRATLRLPSHAGTDQRVRDYILPEIGDETLVTFDTAKAIKFVQSLKTTIKVSERDREPLPDKVDTVFERIEYLRLNADKTIADFCREIGITRGAYTYWAQYKRRPELSRVMLIAERFGVSPGAITGASPFVPPPRVEPKPGILSPRLQHLIIDDARLIFRDATIQTELPANPFREVPKGTATKKRDRDPRWRQKALFTRDEIESLISSESVAEDFRVFFALLFFLGARFGEAAGRRWADWDPHGEPLGMMGVETSYEDQETKTLVPRYVPVHPTLAKVLRAWKLHGFAQFFGRPPRPEDYIVPRRISIGRSRKIKGPLTGPGKPRDSSAMLQTLERCMRRLGMFRKRRQHDFRRSFISIGERDGGNPKALAACTHDGMGDPGTGRAYDSYRSVDWAELCQAVLCIRVGLKGAPEATPIRVVGPADINTYPTTYPNRGSGFGSN